MAELEFKYLNEIDISDSLTDSAHVIVEDGGNIRRAPMNQLVTSSGVSSWNDLTDRPFYEEGSYEEILPEAELSFVNYYGMYMSDTVVDHTKIVIGQTYTMIWDGITYTAPAFASSGQAEEGGETITLAAIGNPGISNSGEDNGIPFYGCNTYSGGAVIDQFAVVTTDTAATHTLSISAGSTTIHTLDEKFIPDTIARVSDIPEGSAQINTDWNQNDSAQPDYVKNRTHWVEGSVETLIENQNFTLKIDKNGIAACSLEAITLVAGETYTVVVDGAERILTAENIFWAETDCVCIGDITVLDDANTSSELGFIILYAPTYSPEVSMFAMVSDEETHILSLYKSSTTYHPLDEGFIPDTIARKSDVTWENLSDKPFGESGATIEWDGSTEGRETAELNNVYYKVSDKTLSIDEIIGASITAGDSSDPLIIDSSNIVTYQGIDVFEIALNGHGLVLVVGSNIENGPTKGVYFYKDIMRYISSLTYSSTKTIDPKFLPEATAVADAAGEAPTAAEFNALLAALREAGYLAT